jgi:mercuric ion binding protein
MKTKVLSILMMMGLGSLTLFAGPVKTEKFKVAGNCGLCETRIEKAAKSVEGVTAANWNKETKMIEVSFDAAETNILKVHEAIAKVGHDTELVKADDETYANLPGCCKYERLDYDSSTSSESARDSHAGHMH